MAPAITKRLDRVYAKRPKRRWHLWLAIAVLVIDLASFLATIFGAFSPLLSPAVYPALAPSGWHNITPHGKVEISAYTASIDEPGVVAVCGSLNTITVTAPATWPFGQTHLWLSHDGGATWTLSDPPFGAIGYCDLVFPPGGHGTLVAAISPNDYTSKGPLTIWISHDQGRTWRVVETVQHTSTIMTSGYIGTWLYRSGTLYGEHATTQSPDAPTFSRSEDNGLTWSALPEASNADQMAQDYTPDYRQDHAWYRVLAPDNSLPALLHSDDDGATWTSVGPIFTFTVPTITTSPLAPGHLCAATTTESAADLTMLASADGGVTWHVGIMPSNVRTASTAEALGDALLDNQGNCYLGVHLLNGSLDSSRYVFLQQTHSDDHLRLISIPNSVNAAPWRLIVPDAHGSRLIFESLQHGSASWAYLFADAASETGDKVLIWRSVP